MGTEAEAKIRIEAEVRTGKGGSTRSTEEKIGTVAMRTLAMKEVTLPKQIMKVKPCLPKQKNCLVLVSMTVRRTGRLPKKTLILELMMEMRNLLKTRRKNLAATRTEDVGSHARGPRKEIDL